MITVMASSLLNCIHRISTIRENVFRLHEDIIWFAFAERSSYPEGTISLKHLILLFVP